MMSEKEVNNKIYIMQLYTEAFCEKYGWTIEQFLKEDSEKGILDAILTLSWDLDSLPMDMGMEEVEEYLNDED